MSNTKFWKPAYQLFKPEEPLNKPEDLRDFYVQRANSPVDSLITSLEMEDDPAKFLLAGHRGGGKTTELRWLQQQLNPDYTVIWVDTETALDRYNIGYAEVVVLIGVKIFETVRTDLSSMVSVRTSNLPLSTKSQPLRTPRIRDGCG